MNTIRILPKEYQSKLTPFTSPSGHWVIGLPIGVNPNEVSPPCRISIACTHLDIQYKDGIITPVLPEPLAVSEIIKMLSEIDIHQFSPVPALSVAHTINNAVCLLCDIAGIPVPT